MGKFETAKLQAWVSSRTSTLIEIVTQLFIKPVNNSFGFSYKSGSHKCLSWTCLSGKLWACEARGQTRSETGVIVGQRPIPRPPILQKEAKFWHTLGTKGVWGATEYKFAEKISHSLLDCSFIGICSRPFFWRGFLKYFLAPRVYYYPRPPWCQECAKT